MAVTSWPFLIKLEMRSPRKLINELGLAPRIITWLNFFPHLLILATC